MKVYTRTSVGRLITQEVSWHQGRQQKQARLLQLHKSKMILFNVLFVWLYYMLQYFPPDLTLPQPDNNDEKTQGHTNGTSALYISGFKFCFVRSTQVEGNSVNPRFWWCNATFSLNPLAGLHETINESVLFSGGSVLVRVSVMKLLFFFFILTLLEPLSPFRINIQKPLIKNPTPHPPLEQNKQIWGCVCSLLAHRILYFNDFTSPSEKKRKKTQDGTMQQNVT